MSMNEAESHQGEMPGETSRIAETAPMSDHAEWRRTAKLVAVVIFVLWVLGFMVPEIIQLNPYVIWYTVVLGGFLLVIREPVARALRRSRIPDALSFVVLSAVLCTAEVWIRIPIRSLEFLIGFLLLFGWCLGVLLVGRFLRLGMIELWLVTGFSGWFQEIMIFHKGELTARPGRSILVLAWAVWAYAMLVLIPVSLIPGPDAKPASSGRWWRYILAFAVPILMSQLLGRAGILVFGLP
jgi:hypothetical protein